MMQNLLVVPLIWGLAFPHALANDGFYFYGPDETCAAVGDAVLGATKAWAQNSDAVAFEVLKTSIAHASERAGYIRGHQPRTLREQAERKQTKKDGNVPAVAYTRFDGFTHTRVLDTDRHGVGFETSYENEVVERLKAIELALTRGRLDQVGGSRGYSFVGAGQIGLFLDSLKQEDVPDAVVPDPEKLAYPMKVGGIRGRGKEEYLKEKHGSHFYFYYVLPLFVGAMSFQQLNIDALTVGQTVLFGLYSVAAMFNASVRNERRRLIPASAQLGEGLEYISDVVKRYEQIQEEREKNPDLAYTARSAENYFIMNGINSPYGVNLDFVFTMINAEPVLTVFTWTPKNFGAQARYNRATAGYSDGVTPNETNDDLTELLYKMGVNQVIVRRQIKPEEQASVRVKFDLEGNAFYFDRSGEVILGLTAEQVLMYPLHDEVKDGVMMAPVGKLDEPSERQTVVKTTEGDVEFDDLVADFNSLLEGMDR